MTIAAIAKPTIAQRLARYDWRAAEGALEEQGWCTLPKLLTASECRALARDYEDAERYRSTVDMQRHRFGQGQYRYFAYPLPPLVQSLRRSLYARLVRTANAWMARLGRDVSYPPTLAGFLGRCHAAGQTRPTPLVLRYGCEDYNRLHQDVYGALGFPLQVLILLSQRGQQYGGGEVIFLEQQPRTQSKATAVAPDRGDALVFTNRERPVRGSRGFYAAQMRHGASPITCGQRFVLGIIFHDAA